MAASALRFYAEPDLRSPVLLLAYGGWNDAGESATTAVRHLLSELESRPLAYVDTEEFLDFTVARPHVRQSSRGRQIVWPHHEFFGVSLPGAPHDLILGLGIEPHLRWKAYCRCVVELARRAGVSRTILLGAFLADVIYSQPIRVGGFTTDEKIALELGLLPSSYEGPTGIVGVLTDAFRREALPAVSLWASLPHYVAVTPNTRGALALLNEVARTAEIPLDLAGLEGDAAEFDEQVSELIAADPQLSAYVRELKKRAFSQ